MRHQNNKNETRKTRRNRLFKTGVLDTFLTLKCYIILHHSQSVKLPFENTLLTVSVRSNFHSDIAVSEKTLYLHHRIPTSRSNPADIAVYLPFVWGGRIERLPACRNVDTLSKRHFLSNSYNDKKSYYS